MVVRRDIEDKIRKTAEKFGYQEVATPTFEDAALFIQKSGPEIVEQLYLFKDKAGRELVLRPELTAPVIRFYASDLYKMPKPLKVYYFGNCFRYERPQKGRFREFWQFGSELIGTDSAEGIAELIAFACSCLSNVGLRNYKLRIGFLEVLKNILSHWEIFGNEQKQFLTALDKGDIESIQMILEGSGRTNEEIDMFFKVVTEKIQLSNFKDRKKVIIEWFPDNKESMDRLEDIIDFLKVFNINDFQIDLGIARGLDYYTGIVFEIDMDSLGAEKQVCGGGEYSLSDLFELKDAPCSGFAIGFDRVVLAYELEGLGPAVNELDLFIIPLSKPGLKKAIELSDQLRRSGFKVDFDIKGRNMSKNLKYASARMAKFVAFLGDDELKSGSALIRQMISGKQFEIGFNNLNEFFQEHL